MNAFKFENNNIKITYYRFESRFREVTLLSSGKKIKIENAEGRDMHCVTVENAFGATGSAYEATKDASIQAAIRNMNQLEADVRAEVASNPALKKSRSYRCFNF